MEVRPVWHLGTTQRSDSFLTQAFPSLRSDSNLIQFNRQLKRCGYDLVSWRKTVEPRASSELRRGFELLDLDGGIGWELLTSMVRYKARQRTSAKAALAHPYFGREGLLALSFMQSLRLQLFRATQQDYSEAASWVIRLMAKSGTKQDGGFTEAQLQELRVSIQHICSKQLLESYFWKQKPRDFATWFLSLDKIDYSFLATRFVRPESP